MDFINDVEELLITFARDTVEDAGPAILGGRGGGLWPRHFFA